MQLCFEDCANKLTAQELRARDIMVNAFNPVLKFFLSQANPVVWKQYGYNSCRQTAILGAVYLKDLLPDYAIVPYEGEFIENDNGRILKYAHCFIIASKADRHLIIDISRTSKKLLFNVITDLKNPYPKTGDYQNSTHLYSAPVDMGVHFYQCDFNEFITGEPPQKLFAMIKTTIDSLDAVTMMRLRDCMYRAYTIIDK